MNYLIFPLLVFAINANAQVDLKGITAVRPTVVISDGEGTGTCVRPILRSLNIDRDVLRTEMELRIRESGLKIAASGLPVLALDLDACPTHLHIDLHLIEWVTLDRRRERAFLGTWGADIVIGLPVPAESIRRLVTDMVSRFLNEWEKAQQ